MVFASLVGMHGAARIVATSTAIQPQQFATFAWKHATSAAQASSGWLCGARVAPQLMNAARRDVETATQKWLRVNAGIVERVLSLAQLRSNAQIALRHSNYARLAPQGWGRTLCNARLAGTLPVRFAFLAKRKKVKIIWTNTGTAERVLMPCGAQNAKHRLPKRQHVRSASCVEALRCGALSIVLHLNCRAACAENIFKSMRLHANIVPCPSPRKI